MIPAKLIARVDTESPSTASMTDAGQIMDLMPRIRDGKNRLQIAIALLLDDLDRTKADMLAAAERIAGQSDLLARRAIRQ
jgi:hypothetical protein